MAVLLRLVDYDGVWAGELMDVTFSGTNDEVRIEHPCAFFAANVNRIPFASQVTPEAIVERVVPTFTIGVLFDVIDLVGP